MAGSPPWRLSLSESNGSTEVKKQLSSPRRLRNGQVGLLLPYLHDFEEAPERAWHGRQIRQTTELSPRMAADNMRTFWSADLETVIKANDSTAFT